MAEHAERFKREMEKSGPRAPRGGMLQVQSADACGCGCGRPAGVVLIAHSGGDSTGVILMNPMQVRLAIEGLREAARERGWEL